VPSGHGKSINPLKSKKEKGRFPERETPERGKRAVQKKGGKNKDRRSGVVYTINKTWWKKQVKLIRGVYHVESEDIIRSIRGERGFKKFRERCCLRGKGVRLK